MGKWINRVAVTRGLFLANAIIWLGFAVYTLVGMANRGYGSMTMLYVIAALMAANAGFMLIVGSLLAPGRIWIYFLSLTLLVVNILFTITDEFGVFDLLTLLIDMVLLGLLVVSRGVYLVSQD